MRFGMLVISESEKSYLETTVYWNELNTEYTNPFIGALTMGKGKVAFRVNKNKAISGKQSIQEIIQDILVTLRYLSGKDKKDNLYLKKK